jgi:hypothetical protein
MCCTLHDAGCTHTHTLAVPYRIAPPWLPRRTIRRVRSPPTVTCRKQRRCGHSLSQVRAAGYARGWRWGHALSREAAHANKSASQYGGLCAHITPGPDHGRCNGRLHVGMRALSHLARGGANGAVAFVHGFDSHTGHICIRTWITQDPSAPKPLSCMPKHTSALGPGSPTPLNVHPHHISTQPMLQHSATRCNTAGATWPPKECTRGGFISRARTCVNRPFAVQAWGVQAPARRPVPSTCLGSSRLLCGDRLWLPEGCYYINNNGYFYTGIGPSATISTGAGLSHIRAGNFRTVAHGWVGCTGPRRREGPGTVQMCDDPDAGLCGADVGSSYRRCG